MRPLAALALIGLAAACAPTDPASRLGQQIAVCEGDGVGLPQQRLEACSAVIAASGDDPARRASALVDRGVIRAEMAEDARAVADFGRALRIDPGLARALLERGQVHASREAFDHAIRDYDAALALQPNSQQAWELREAAVYGRSEGQLDELDLLTRALAENPNEPGLWNNRCWVRALSGEELEYALADCNEALRLDPDNAAALDSRALVHFKRGDFDAAIADYNAALAVDPGRGHYLYGRGLARRGKGEVAAGQADMAAGERAQPGVAGLYQSYGVEI